MTDTISSEDGAQWPVLDRPPYSGGIFARLTAATRTTALTAAVSLVLVGGVTTVTVRSLGQGADPAQVVPASAFAIAQVDLSLPDGQAGALAHLVNRFPGAPKGSGSIRDRLLGAIFADSTDPHIDYRKSVQPWLGDHAAVAGWIDDSGDPHLEYVLQSTDDGAARKALHDASPDSGVSFSRGFAIVASSQQLADATARAANKSSLADKATYSGDLDALGDGSPAATGWVDGPGTVKALARLLGSKPGGPQFLSMSGLTESLTDRVVAGLRVSDDGDNSAVQLDVVSRGVTKTGRTTSTDRLRHLPTPTFAAVAVADPSGVVRNATNAISGPLAAFFGGFSVGASCSFSSNMTVGPDGTTTSPPPTTDDPCLNDIAPPDATPADPLDAISKAIGLKLPDDLVSLLGSDAVVAYGGLTAGGQPKIGLRSKPADINAAADVVGKLRNTLGNSGIDLAERTTGGDFIVATTGDYADSLSTPGSLGTSEKFADAMRGMPSSVGFAAYVDLGTVLPVLTSGTVPQLDHLSALGIWVGTVNGASMSRVRLIVH